MPGTASPDTGSYAGAHSPRLKAARRLNKRAFRQRERAFLAEGPQAVAEAFHCGAQVTDLFVTVPARSRHHDLVAAMAAAGIPVHLVSGEVMDELAQTVTPQGLLAVCGFVDVPLAEVTARGRPQLVALLANVRDPGNAGTVLRTADAAGAHAVVFADASVDPYNGKCVRASAGSLFHLPVAAGVRVDDAVVTLREAGLRIVAADGRAGRPWTTLRCRPGWPGRRPGCSGTRRGGCRPNSLRWPTSRSRCPSTAGPRASTWRPRLPCVSTRPRVCNGCRVKGKRGSKWGDKTVLKCRLVA